uniref:Hint domain-containing protein n=1 Tax=Panagrolaimus sp. ES5 TaxID=591445 RepID=A0AC34GTT2_9BILA
MVFIVTTIVENVFASFCGENALPYSFEILPSGSSILGCANPNCLGWANNRGAPSRFYNDDGQVDGFVRELKNFHSFTNDTAECEDDYTSKKCIQDGEWIGGIKPPSQYNNKEDATTDELLFRCCYHSDIKIAKFLTAYDIKVNEKFEGGEVFDADTGEQQYFDYINNIVKFITDKGVLTYEVFVNRLPCVPILKSHKMIESNITISNNKKSIIDTTKLFQAPTFVAASEFLPVVEGGSSIPMEAVNLPPPILQNNGLANANSFQAAASNTQIQPPIQNNIQAPPTNNFQGAPNIQSFQPMNSVPFIQSNMNPSVSASGSQAPTYPYYPINTCTSASAQSAPDNNLFANPFACGFLCFSGDTLVTTMNGQKKRLDELEINEWILSSGGNVTSGYSKVNSWIHRMPKVEAEFIKFTLEDGKELKITDKHFIYRGNCSQVNSSVAIDDAIKDMVYAEDIRSTDCLFVNNNRQLIETKITKIEKTLVLTPKM